MLYEESVKFTFVLRLEEDLAHFEGDTLLICLDVVRVEVNNDNWN